MYVRHRAEGGRGWGVRRPARRAQEAQKTHDTKKHVFFAGMYIRHQQRQPKHFIYLSSCSGDHAHEGRGRADHRLQGVGFRGERVPVVHHLLQQLVDQAEGLLDGALVHVAPEVVPHDVQHAVQELDNLETYVTQERLGGGAAESKMPTTACKRLVVERVPGYFDIWVMFVFHPHTYPPFLLPAPGCIVPHPRTSKDCCCPTYHLHHIQKPVMVDTCVDCHTVDDTR